MMIVSIEKGMPDMLKADCRARPVMMPGNARGSTNGSDIVSRPKNLKRWMPKATITPSTSAMAVAATPALMLSHRTLRAAAPFHATPSQ